MSLNFQTVSVTFEKGLDTKTQRKLVIPSKWDQLNNVSMAEDNTPQRRDGVGGIISSAAGGSGNGLATYNKELLVINGAAIGSVGAQGLQSRSGKLGYVQIDKAEIRRSGGMQSGYDCATGNGLTCYAWVDSTMSANAVTAASINVTIIDESSGTQILSNVAIKTSATVLSPRVVFSPSAGGVFTEAFMIFYLEGTSLCCVVIQTSTPTVIGAEVKLITSASLALDNFDAISGYINAVRKGAMVSYWWTDATTSLRTIHVTHSNGVPAIDAGPTNLMTRAQLSDLTRQAVCVVEFDSTHYGTFAIAQTGTKLGLAGVITNDAYVVTTAATQLDAGAASAFAGATHLTGVAQGANVYLYSDQAPAYGNAQSVTPIRTTNVTNALAITSGPTSVLNSAIFTPGVAGFAAGPSGPWIAGKAFVAGTSVYLPTAIYERNFTLSTDEGSTDPSTGVFSPGTLNEQNSFHLFEAFGANHDSLVPVARALAGTVGFPLLGAGSTSANVSPSVNSPCSTPLIVAAGGNGLAIGEQSALAFDNGLNISASGIARLMMTPKTTVAPLRAQLGQTTFIAGGALTAYDGATVVEHGFPLFPEGTSAVRSAAAGNITAGVHQVVWIYEWTDNAGKRNQSTPSQPVSFTSLGADTATCVVPTLLVSQKTGVQIVGYMTQAGGVVFNRVISIAAPVPNVTTAAVVTVTLGGAAHPCSDAQIKGNELLYNQPDALSSGSSTTLPNDPPGPMSTLAIHQNRLFFDKTDDPYAFGYSQQVVAGVGLQFSSTLGGMVDASSGGIVGFCSMDEKLIIFCARKPYVLYGQGPDSTGGFSNYGAPQDLPSDVGCVEARSILKMPNGIMFKSSKGWYLLGRDLVARYIGTGAAAYNANDVSAAVLLENQQECRFPSSSGTHLVYNYLTQDPDGAGQWSTSTISAAESAYLISDSLWWTSTSGGGELVHVSLTQGLNSDTPGVYLDSPNGLTPKAIVMTYRTSFMRPGALEGYQRVRRFYLTGTSPNAPTSTLSVSVDYDDAYNGAAPGSYSFSTVFSTITFPAGMPIDIRAKLRRQKCKSIAFTFVDTPLVANPAGVTFQVLALDVGIKPGVNRLSAAQSVG